METVDLREAKWRYRWYNIKEKAKNLGRTIVENKEIAVPLIAAGAGVANGVMRVTAKAIQNHAVNKEIDFKRRTIYDRSLGRYIETKKPLTNDQALIVEMRHKQGEGYMAILDDMGLLKKR